MKKFLTVLLVIAVMFTFSFGSAFAAVAGTTLSDSQQAAYDAAVGPSGVILDAKFNAAWAANEDHIVTTTMGYTITTKAYAGFEAEAKAAVEEALYDAAKTGKNAVELAGMLEADYIIKTIVDVKFADKLALAQFEIDYAKEIAKLDTVDVYAYSTEDYDADYTHQEKAAAIIAKAKADAAAIAGKIDSDATLAKCVVAIMAIDDIVSDDLDGSAATEVLKKVTLDGIFTGAYELTDAKLLKSEDAAADKAVTEAQKAALKAIVAKEVATYAKAAGTKADSKLIDAYTEMYTVRIDSKYATTEEAIAGVEFFAGTKVVDNYNAVQKLVAAAEKYKAEKDADGNLVRSAEAIDKIVAKAKKAAYNSDQTYAWNGLTDAIEEIEALTVESTAAGLDYAKETAKTLIANFVDDSDCYPAELAKLNAIAEEAAAKIDATTKTDDITKAVTGLYAKYMAKLEAVKDIDEVNDDLDAKTAYINAKTALEEYVKYYNSTLTTTAEKAGMLDAAAIEDVLDEFYGEAGARTESEMKAMKDQVISLVDKLPTAGAQAEAKKAAQDAIDAIPAVVTLADEAAVQAAVDAVKALHDVYGAELAAKYTNALNAAKAELYNAYRLDLNKKVVAVDKADKEAVKALIAEFKAAQKKNGETVKGKCLAGVDLKTISAYTTLTNALEDIQDAERAAVKKAINAIPINVTEADEAVVKAARAAYNAYVAEYTDYEDEKFAGNAAEEFEDCYRELALAEAALGLNAEDPAYSVESLKIKARTDKAKKGSITVRWTVVDGDASAVEGYEIWKSTKHSSGYKKMITKSADSDWYKNTKGLKKGTRYYYKVRAIAYTEDGVKVKSDFSNKARRIAK